MLRRLRWFRVVPVAVVATLATVPGRAFAFCPATTCESCQQPRGACVSEGFPLRWSSDCVSYDLQQNASKQVPLAVAAGVTARAFSHWTSVSCPATGLPPTITTLMREPVACDRVEYNNPYAKRGSSDAGSDVDEPRVGGNANIIVFRDAQWTSTKTNDPNSTIALTTVTFATNSGEILDADIEVNSTLSLSTADATPATAYDLESILTHEIGHFLGLAHSNVACSTLDCPTMTASYTMGQTHYRTLEADDVEGICAIYPKDRGAASTACTPMFGFAVDCGLPLVESSGCTVSSAGAGLRGSGKGWAPLALSALAYVRSRRRKNRQAAASA